MSMHARVMRVELGDVDRATNFVRDQIVPSATQQPGIIAAYWLVDRASGRGLAVSIWESEDAILASEAAAKEAARTEQQDGAVQSAAVERFEVIAHL